MVRDKTRSPPPSSPTHSIVVDRAKPPPRSPRHRRVDQAPRPTAVCAPPNVVQKPRRAPPAHHHDRAVAKNDSLHRAPGRPSRRVSASFPGFAAVLRGPHIVVPLRVPGGGVVAAENQNRAVLARSIRKDNRGKSISSAPSRLSRLSSPRLAACGLPLSHFFTSSRVRPLENLPSTLDHTSLRYPPGPLGASTMSWPPRTRSVFPSPAAVAAWQQRLDQGVEGARSCQERPPSELA